MKKAVWLTKSRLRGIFEKHTDNEHLIDACMRVCGASVGFEAVAPEDFYREDRCFMKRVKRMTSDQIDNSPLWFQYEFARKPGSEIIKQVKVELRDMV